MTVLAFRNSGKKDVPEIDMRRREYVRRAAQRQPTGPKSSVHTCRFMEQKKKGNRRKESTKLGYIYRFRQVVIINLPEKLTAGHRAKCNDGPGLQYPCHCQACVIPSTAMGSGRPNIPKENWRSPCLFSQLKSNAASFLSRIWSGPGALRWKIEMEI